MHEASVGGWGVQLEASFEACNYWRLLINTDHRPLANFECAGRLVGYRDCHDELEQDSGAKDEEVHEDTVIQCEGQAVAKTTRTKALRATDTNQTRHNHPGMSRPLPNHS